MRQLSVIGSALAVATLFLIRDAGHAGARGGGRSTGGYRAPEGGHAQKYVKVDGYMVRRQPQRKIELDPVIMAKRSDKRDYIKYFVPLQNGDLYTCYWYKEKADDNKYRCHVYYYPSHDSNVYLYNPYEKVWYGRYDRKNNKYENVSLSEQKSNLQDVDPAAWKSATFPKIPNSLDGRVMRTPPAPPSIEIKKTKIKVVNN